jgi:RNA polymerase sigma factor (sigma-70 family)
VSDEPPGGARPATDLAALAPVVRGVIAPRVPAGDVVDDLVQETLVRVLAARHRLDPEALAPYAVVVARNLVSERWRDTERSRRHAHRFLDVPEPRRPEDEVLRREEAHAVSVALAQLSPRERDGLLAHEVQGRDTGSLATEWASTPGAVAAQLHRARAKLRVGYLLAEAGSAVPTSRCRPVLLAISGGQQRRQRELDVGHHLLECEFCAATSEALIGRTDVGSDERVAVRVEAAPDVVVARQKGRELAATVGFGPTDLTLIATAISEIARNIVKFTERGEVTIAVVEDGERRGVTVIARDAGPGIPDLDLAMEDGYSTYGGMGLGLAGSRRLMDEFHISSEVGRGTTVVMTKWRSARGWSS